MLDNRILCWSARHLLLDLGLGAGVSSRKRDRQRGGGVEEEPFSRYSLQDGMEKSIIRIRLKDFTRTTTGPLPDCGGLDDCSWDPSSQSITLLTDKYVAPKTELRFTIPASAGLALPSQGVLTDDT